MMHIIYECARITIVALSGKNSNAGLPGVALSFPRVRQSRETICGSIYFTVPRHAMIDQESSEWSARAWTLQEGIMSTRCLFLSEYQARFGCDDSQWTDATNMDYELENWRSMDAVPAHPSSLVLQTWVKGRNMGPVTHSTTPNHMRLYGGIIHQYTSLRMSFDVDSLNACLGILGGMQRRLFPSGFVWGLPLQSHPQTLAWLHDRKVGPSPARRAAFPSWSWAGWAGNCLLPDWLIEDPGRGKGTEVRRDLRVTYLTSDGPVITVEGWKTTLQIITEPFSEVYRPGILGEENIVGYLAERNFLHNNTVPSGIYEFLVVERVSVRNREDDAFSRQRVYLLLLEKAESTDLGTLKQIWRRTTMVTLTPRSRQDFMVADPLKCVIHLR